MRPAPRIRTGGSSASEGTARTALELVVPATGRPDLSGTGRTVTLHRRGLLLRTDIGSAEIGPGAGRQAVIPAEAVIPFRSDALVEATVPAIGFTVLGSDTAR